MNLSNNQNPAMVLEPTPSAQSRIPFADRLHGLKPADTLRWVGGMILAAAAVAFMLQGIYSFSPMTRHWLMLAVCLMLGIFGMVTGNVLKEQKGARLFLGLAAASFPALASQLGAMFFSVFGSPPAGMPQPLVYTPANSSLLLVITGLTLAIIVPVSHLAFRILARPQAGTLTMVYTLANLCILIPLRVDFWISAIITCAAGVVLWVDHTKFSRDFRLDSFEGRASRLMLSGPLAVMITRTFFYPMDPVYYGCMLLLSGSCFTFCWGRIARKNWLRKASRIGGLMAMTAGWLVCFGQILNSYDIGEAFIVYLGLLPLSVVLVGHSFAYTGKMAKYQRLAAAVIALIGVLFAHGAEATIQTSMVALGSAAAVLALGTLVAEKRMILIGAITGILGLGNLGLLAFQMQTGYAWLILAIIGIGVMFGASLMEVQRSWRFLQNSSLWGKLNRSSN